MTDKEIAKFTINLINQKENENEYRCVRGFYDENCFHS